MMVRKERLDKVLTDRGFASSRERARALIMEGKVFVNGQRIEKPGTKVKFEVDIEIHGEDNKYVSRGGLKLEAALNAFGIDPKNKIVLDVGASTGGFTDCVLQEGQKRFMQ